MKRGKGNVPRCLQKMQPLRGSLCGGLRERLRRRSGCGLRRALALVERRVGIVRVAHECTLPLVALGECVPEPRTHARAERPCDEEPRDPANDGSGGPPSRPDDGSFWHPALGQGLRPFSSASAPAP